MANYYSAGPDMAASRLYSSAGMPPTGMPSYEQQPAYGSVHGAAGPMKAPVARGPRRRMNIVAVILALLVPVGVFAVVLAATSFSLHYQQPSIMYLIVGFTLVALLAVGAVALDAVRRKARNEPQREPTWYVFIFATGLLAWVIALAAGSTNFHSNMQPFYDVLNLNTYPSVDPSKMRGQQMMDAGRVVFVDTARVDITKSMAFKNLEVYCVAPITLDGGNSTFSTLASYDFWAVGLGCCSGAAADFHCGEFNNPRAHAGLRLMQDEQRPYFRLAVQQAEAAYNIKAPHPIFLHWMQDPIAEVNAYQDDGVKYFLLGLFSHFVFQLFLVIAAVIAFSKWGAV